MDVRDMLRASQSAELQGDIPSAVKWLRQAAESCRRSGLEGRAEQLLRHAERLEAKRDPIPQPTLRVAAAPPPVAPVAAVPSPDARCAFCCRPQSEAGPMAAGVTGARICGSCAEVALRALAADAETPEPRGG